MTAATSGVCPLALLALEVCVFGVELVALFKHYAESNESKQVFHGEVLAGV